MEEIWKDIPNYEGWYQASNMGRIRSLDRTESIKCRWGGYCERIKKGRILQLTPINSGYLIVGLGKKRNNLVHRLVWEAFNGSIPEGMEINHINENKNDNRLENLIPLSHKDNVNFGTAVKRIVKKNKKHILQTTTNGDEMFCWFSIKDASLGTGISTASIWLCLNHRYNTAGGYKWEYI